MRMLIKVSGEELALPGKQSMSEIKQRIGAEMLDTVMLRDRVHVMVVDDTGAVDGRPVNEKATRLYWEKCGGPVQHAIHGDVVVVPDADYA